ncbi:MAG: phosphatase PAP2 family protein [Gemmatimonadales bacterium]|nr:MAG: phosphatase PAP2 family protein [Gemmatimonadales bacterium]
MIRGLRLSALALVALLVASCGSEPDELDATDAHAFVTEWIDGVYGLIAVEMYSPPRASRVYGYLGVALYEGWVHGLDGMRSAVGLLNDLDGLPEPDAAPHDWPVVAAASAHGLMEHLFFGTTGSTLNAIDDLRDEQVERRRATGVEDRTVERSLAYGESLAEALIEWAERDGYRDTRGVAYTPPVGPDMWVPTAEYGTSLALNPVLNMVYLYDDLAAAEGRVVQSQWQSDRMHLTARPGAITDHNVAMEPFWGELRPFVISDPAEFPVIPHKAYSEEPGSPFHDELMEVYQISLSLTDEQIHIAHFWADNPGETGTPGGHWMKLASQLMTQLELSVPEALEITLLTSLSVADAFIACWDAKYRINLVRPKTLINRWIDPYWQTELVTPPFPEYPSGHSTVSGAAATSLTALLGEVPFVDRTHENRFGYEARPFGSFAEAGQEAAHSRLYGGIHYPMANQNGLEHGERIGRVIAQRLLSHMHGESFQLEEHLSEPLFEPIPPPDWDPEFRLAGQRP